MATATLQDSIRNARTLKLAHTSAVVLNEVIVSNSKVLVSVEAKDADTDCAYIYKGKVQFPKEAPLVINALDTVYWDATAGKITKTASPNTVCGYCVEGAASAATVVSVMLDPAHA